MSKTYKFVKGHINPESSNTNAQNCEIDWSLCVICQEQTNETLRSATLSSNASSVGAGYKSLAENLQNFYKIGALPKSLKVIIII